ncbi:c_GCAxxG_C_C family protein [gut metagenome]|uniref:C_GCAxxG_C_C family protein n=1 Tax=gut metagenome TaxID=749906 RepID=J9GJQ8_9ZZZZ
MYEERVEKAVELFKSGYNCSQSVVAAFADLYDFTPEQAFRMAASFGGGIGRMRQTCGAACGMFLLAGLDTGATEGSDREGKSHNYAVVQDLAGRFKEENGSMICAELLGLRQVKVETDNPQAEARTAAYYKKRPCVKMVETAARLFADYLERKAQDDLRTE